MMQVYGIDEDTARALWLRLLTKTDQDGDAEAPCLARWLDCLIDSSFLTSRCRFNQVSFEEWKEFTSKAASMGKLANLQSQIERIKAARA
jgi:hypothetical protein